jgi:hypothetical protein
MHIKKWLFQWVIKFLKNCLDGWVHLRLTNQTSGILIIELWKYLDLEKAITYHFT